MCCLIAVKLKFLKYKMDKQSLHYLLAASYYDLYYNT